MEEEKFRESEMIYTFIFSLCVHTPTGKTNTPVIVAEKRVVINIGVFQMSIISSMYLKETAPKSVYFHCFSHIGGFFRSIYNYKKNTAHLSFYAIYW